MREFESVFDKGLVGGLRSAAVEPEKEQRLVELKNLRPSEFGLRPVEDIDYPFSEVFAWPFPQMFMLSELRLMATETAVYECDSTWFPVEAIDGLLTGGPWHVADFGDFILMTNGSQIVQRSGAGVWSSFASTANIPSMETMCNFRGRVIGGNVSGWEDCAQNSVVWSNIGSADFNLSMSNEAGYAAMSWNGAVLKVLELGDMIAVYGENGVSLLKPAKQFMGIRDLDLPGIPSVGAVGGSPRGHLMVDFAGDLWLIGPDGKTKNIGYSEYISTLDASELMISFNPQQNEYYISDGMTGFILGNSGLCQTHQLVSSLAFDNQLYGTYESDGDEGALVTTDTINFGQQAFKTVSAISANCSSTGNMWVRLFWRSSIYGTFLASDWQWVNYTGFVSPVITAVDFRISFKADNYSDVKLASFKSRLKLSDKRMIRGVYNAN